MAQSLKTPRLVLIRQSDTDPEDLAAYHRRNRAFHAPWSPLRDEAFFTSENQAELANSDHADLKFSLLKDQELVGLVTFSGVQGGAFQAAYLGFSLDESAQGKGLMFEALAALIAHVFRAPIFEGQPLHRIMAAHMPENQRSAALLKRLGFEREGYARDYLKIAGAWEDHVRLALLND